MKSFMGKLEHLLEIGGTKKDITLLVISGVALIFSLTGILDFLPFNIARQKIQYCLGFNHFVWCADYFRSDYWACHSV